MQVSFVLISSGLVLLPLDMVPLGQRMILVLQITTTSTLRECLPGYSFFCSERIYSKHIGWWVVVLPFTYTFIATFPQMRIGGLSFHNIIYTFIHQIVLIQWQYLCLAEYLCINFDHMCSFVIIILVIICPCAYSMTYRGLDVNLAHF